jgi:hypothetical protein
MRLSYSCLFHDLRIVVKTSIADVYVDVLLLIRSPSAGRRQRSSAADVLTTVVRRAKKDVHFYVCDRRRVDSKLMTSEDYVHDVHSTSAQLFSGPPYAGSPQVPQLLSIKRAGTYIGLISTRLGLPFWNSKLTKFVF